jgi:hypothetical protein
MRFIPVDFCKPNPAISETDSSNALHLPPVALAIQATKSREISDSSASRDRFNVSDIAGELEVHSVIRKKPARQAVESSPANLRL